MLFDLLCIREITGSQEARKKILWLTDEAGEVMADMAIIKYLVKLGHKIIVVFKEGPLFTKVDFYDALEDETLADELKGCFFHKGEEPWKK